MRAVAIGKLLSKYLMQRFISRMPFGGHADKGYLDREPQCQLRVVSYFVFFFALSACFFLFTFGAWLADTVARVRSIRTSAIVSSRT